MSLYFAYGSNMNISQMAARCPQSRRLGSAQLPAWRWIIAADGFASVLPAQEATVEGSLFEVSPTDEAALDAYEEVSSGAYTRHYLPVQYQQQTVTALVYINTASGEGKASAEYSRILQQGVADAGLSQEYFMRYMHPFMPD